MKAINIKILLWQKYRSESIFLRICKMSPAAGAKILAK
jgi:hypothetical protein